MFAESRRKKAEVSNLLGLVVLARVRSGEPSTKRGLNAAAANRGADAQGLTRSFTPSPKTGTNDAAERRDVALFRHDAGGAFAAVDPCRAPSRTRSEIFRLAADGFGLRHVDRNAPTSTVIDPTPSNRLDGGVQLVAEIASQFFKDGIENADYILTYLITFSDGSLEAFDAVKMRQRRETVEHPFGTIKPGWAQPTS